ncbi:omega-hydroxypalmitate O-feruloyl transferase [Carica papaya]|uniref:omega-hydroxypalmitate O-feruloyl transferase n=1 Tax=Carica papaya TaxID=3649 RepID=UPI000B8C9EFE|nr:omega-hydroxypalmitate O-feruloyl transferase [Carica papaya]
MASWVKELHLPNLHIPITVDRILPVAPSKPIPSNTLYLSNLDDIIGARVFTPTVYFYQTKDLNSNQDLVVKILRDALAKVLVPYYPFSGRLREVENGKLEVFFGPNQGALIVQARTKMALDELGDLAVPNPAWLPLIYRFPNEESYKILDMPLLIAQVTLFRCGGFSLGLRLCHCICDGFGAMQFVGAWAATAKTGTLITNPKPCWDREFFKPRKPPVVKYPHVEFMPIDEGSNLTMSLWEAKPVQKCYQISREFQIKLKTLAQSDNSFICTTFDAMAAHVWRSWVKALDVQPPNYQLRLTFSVNARPKLKNPALEQGFYGNVVCVACAMTTVHNLINAAGLADITRLVREARLSISEEYLRSTVDYVERNRPRRLEFGGKLTITQWTRFSIYESADFGWGRPIYAGPVDITPTPQVCVFLPQGDTDPSGTIVVCICLPDYAITRFTEILSLKDTSH